MVELSSTGKIIFGLYLFALSKTKKQQKVSDYFLVKKKLRKNQRNSFSIQRGNATSIRGTFPSSALLSEIFVL
jgi:hypothetical protein